MFFDGLINSDVFQRAQGLWYAIIDTVAFGMRKVNNQTLFASLAFWDYRKSTDVDLQEGKGPTTRPVARDVIIDYGWELLCSL